MRVNREKKLVEYAATQLQGSVCTEAEFLDVIGIKVLGVFLFAIHSLLSPLRTDPPLVCNVPKHCIWKIKVWELSRLSPEAKTTTKLYVHEFGFCTVVIWNYYLHLVGCYYVFIAGHRHLSPNQNSPEIMRSSRFNKVWLNIMVGPQAPRKF
jgi:hypothetical protein